MYFIKLSCIKLCRSKYSQCHVGLHCFVANFTVTYVGNGVECPAKHWRKVELYENCYYFLHIIISI